MSRLDIATLARQPTEPAEALGDRLTEFRSQGANIIECIKYVMLNQSCSLAEAQNIVINSQAWADRKEEFLRQQQEMFEEYIADNKDRIETINMNITPDVTDVVVHMKPPE